MRVALLPATFVITSVGHPSSLAFLSALVQSVVSPDWLMTMTSVLPTTASA